MKKIVKKYGSSFVILLNYEEMKIYNLKEGDIIEVDIKKERKIK